MSGKPSVLIVDGSPRHTIDIVRSLGRQGMRVSIVAQEKFPVARFSRYLSDAYMHPIDFRSFRSTIDYLTGLLSKDPYDVVIASGLNGFRALSFGLPELSQLAKVPIASYDLFEIAEDKAEITKFAEEQGVPVPQTYYPRGVDDLHRFHDIPFPVVVKARQGQGHFAYAHDFQHLRDEVYPHIAGRVPEQLDVGLFPIIQEFVRGKGHGFYALMNHGEVKAYFMHERIREVPPTGGPSAFAKTYYDDTLVEVGSKLLRALRWHGVAMVEFKKDAGDGEYKLIEINPKFWGSLGLSIAAGIDFPRLLVDMAVNGDIGSTASPAKDIHYQWLTMDIAHSLAVKKPLLWLHTVAEGAPNDFCWHDPMPTVALFGQRAGEVLRGRRAFHAVGEGRPDIRGAKTA